MGTSDQESLPKALLLQHEAFLKQLDGRLYRAPIKQPLGRVLDIGAGCGIWAVDLAKENPSAEVVGIDLYDVSLAPPPNCKFLIRDAEKDWDLGDGDNDTFDLIHTRLVPFHTGQMMEVLRQCYDKIKPGGYIEMHEVVPPTRTDEPADSPEHKSKLLEWGRLRVEAALKIGIDQAVTAKLPEMLPETGFIDVQIEDHKWPLGCWSRDAKLNDVGKSFTELVMLSRFDMSMQLLANLGMGEEEIRKLVEEAAREMNEGKTKVYTLARFITARKPL